MKNKNYLIILICILIFVIAEFSAIQIMLKTTRLFPKTEIVLHIENNNIDEYELPVTISKESILELKKAISEVSINNNQEKLLDIFDKERTFYINFITFISIVLSVFGIAPVIYGIFEKNENAKLREELENLKNEYGTRLDKIKLKAVFDWFNDMTASLKSGVNLIFADSTQVNDLNDFYKFIMLYFIKTTNELKFDLLDDNRMQTFAIRISNFMSAIISYSTERYGSTFKINEKSNRYFIKENEIFNNMFIHLQIIFPEEQFKEFINDIQNLPSRKFDCTGF